MYALAGLGIAAVAWGLWLAFTPGAGPSAFDWILMIIVAIACGVILL